jgi:hypothetical protein
MEKIMLQNFNMEERALILIPNIVLSNAVIVIQPVGHKRSRKPRLTTVGDLPRWPRDTPLSTKVGTKFRLQVAVAQSA